MFTGLVKAVGWVRRIERNVGQARLSLAHDPGVLGRVERGDSISVSGCCLTAVSVAADGFSADVSAESLRCTVLGELAEGAGVNLEPALRAGDRLGGHLVSGHVDGVGQLLSDRPEDGSRQFWIRAPATLARYIAGKGSICVDGVSLTVNEVDGTAFSVNVIPHTLAVTTLGGWRTGRRVNLEVDLVARYLERLLLAGDPATTGITRDLLQRYGFAPED